MTTPATTQVEHPVRLRKFTFITGGVGTADLAKALSAATTDTTVVELHDMGKRVLRWVYGPEAMRDSERTPIAKSIDTYLNDLLGSDHAAKAFMVDYTDYGSFDDDDYIFVDATREDIEAFITKFGDAEVLVLETGAMQKAIAKNTCWLPSPDLYERIKLLRRELGTL